MASGVKFDTGTAAIAMSLHRRGLRPHPASARHAFALQHCDKRTGGTTTGTYSACLFSRNRAFMRPRVPLFTQRAQRSNGRKGSARLLLLNPDWRAGSLWQTASFHAADTAVVEARSRSSRTAASRAWPAPFFGLYRCREDRRPADRRSADACHCRNPQQKKEACSRRHRPQRRAARTSVPPSTAATSV